MVFLLDPALGGKAMIAQLKTICNHLLNGLNAWV